MISNFLHAIMYIHAHIQQKCLRNVLSPLYYKTPKRPKLQIFPTKKTDNEIELHSILNR